MQTGLRWLSIALPSSCKHYNRSPWQDQVILLLRRALHDRCLSLPVLRSRKKKEKARSEKHCLPSHSEWTNSTHPRRKPLSKRPFSCCSYIDESSAPGQLSRNRTTSRHYYLCYCRCPSRFCPPWILSPRTKSASGYCPPDNIR